MVFYRFEDSEEDGEERGEMLCDTMMASAYSLNPDSLASASRGQEHLGGRLGVPDSLGGQRNPSHDSLARISSMTNSISPPLHSHGSLSPGENIFKGHFYFQKETNLPIGKSREYKYPRCEIQFIQICWPTVRPEHDRRIGAHTPEPRY